MTETLLGEAESVKLGAAFTVNETVVVAVKLPDVPVIVIVEGPVVAVLDAVNVRELLAVAGLGEKTAVTPAGNVDVPNVTLPLKAFCGAMLIVFEALVPCVTATLAGDAERVKFGDGGAGTETATLSKVAEARAVVLPLLTAKPMYTVAFMVMLWLVLNCVQVTPSGETKLLKLLPLRLILIQ